MDKNFHTIRLLWDPPSSAESLTVLFTVIAVYAFIGMLLIISEHIRHAADRNLRSRYISAGLMVPLLLIPTWLGAIPFATLVAIVSASVSWK